MQDIITTLKKKKTIQLGYEDNNDDDDDDVKIFCSILKVNLSLLLKQNGMWLNYTQNRIREQQI